MRTVLSISSLLLLAAGCAQTQQAGTIESSPSSTSSSDETRMTAAEPVSVRFVGISSGLPERGMWKCDPAFGDVNGDGHVDMTAISRLGKGAQVWLGDGAGNWTDSSEGLSRTDAKSCGGGVGFADFNEDGNLDLVAADHCDGIFVYIGDGQGRWQPVVQGLGPADLAPSEGRASMYAGAEDVAIGDVDSDGHIDLVICASDEGGLSIYHGDGTGMNWTRSARGLPQSGWCNRAALVDMNGDDILDVLASYDAGPRVWHNDGAATFTAASDGLPSPMMRGIYTGIAAGDFNGDGRQDIAVANWSDGPEVFMQQSDGTWEQADDVFPDMLGGAIGLDAGDVDGDGNDDIVVAGRLEPTLGFVRGVFLLLGDGAGTWRYAKDVGLPATGLGSTAGVGLADVDGDGVLDVAACSGLQVESTVEGQKEPALPQRVLMWRTEPTAHAATPRERGSRSLVNVEDGKER